MGLQSIESVKSTVAGLPEAAREAVRNGGKGLSRGALVLRKSFSDHPYLGAAIGLVLAGVSAAALRTGARRRRLERLAAGLVVLATAARKASRGPLSRGMDGATTLGRSLRKWGRKQSLASFARDNAGPALRSLLPVLGVRLLRKRRFV